MFLLPLFFNWRASKQWPNGKGFYYQPLRLKMAFDILSDWYDERAKNGEQA